MEAVFLGVAVIFAVVTGANDGGSVLSAGLKIPGLPAFAAVGILAAFVGLAPLLLSAQVATTLTTRLVPAPDRGALPLILGIAASVVVVAILTTRGLPTSLTLAVIGGLTGAALGSGLPVAWDVVGIVLLVGLSAPVVGAVVAHVLYRLAQRVPQGAAARHTISRTHRVAFGLQCLAYSLNDGQKVLAVFAIAIGLGAATTSGGPPWLAALIGVLFAAGVLLGLPKMARSLNNGVLAARPFHAVSAQLAGTLAVLGSAAVGVPVSMTQAVAGGLIGAGASEGHGRIRWTAAGRMLLAWLITLPASVGVAAAVAAVVS